MPVPSLKILLFLPIIIGVSPLSIKSNLTYARLTHNFFVLLIFALFYALTLTVGETEYYAVANVSVFKQVVNKHLYVFLGFTCVLNLVCERSKLLEFFTQLRLSDHELTKPLLGINVIGIIACFVVFISSAVTNNPYVVLCKTLFVLIQFATFSMFIGCLYVLQARFNRLNASFKDNYNIKIISNFEMKMHNDRFNSSDFNNLAKTHDRLCDLSSTLNEIFSVPLLGCFTLSFLGTLFSVHDDVTLFLNEEARDGVEKFLIVLKNTHMSVFMLALGIVIIVKCSDVCKQANETGKVIHKIINNSESVTTENLKTFSLQLMHRNLAFTACNMFDLDYTLMCSHVPSRREMNILPLKIINIYLQFIGACTTYMVILVQFDLSKT